MKYIWNAIKSIFVNDAHEIISKRGKEILAEQRKEYTFVPNLRHGHFCIIISFIVIISLVYT